MSLSVDDLIAKFPVRFPEFARIGEDRTRMYVEDAVATHNLCDTAALYLAAHLLVLDRDQANGGVDGGLGEITGDKIGKKSSTVKAMAKDAAEVFYTSTPYGRKYLHFRKGCVSRAFSVRVS